MKNSLLSSSFCRPVEYQCLRGNHQQYVSWISGTSAQTVGMVEIYFWEVTGFGSSHGSISPGNVALRVDCCMLFSWWKREINIFFSPHTSFCFQKSVPKHKGQILLFGIKVAHLKSLNSLWIAVSIIANYIKLTKHETGPLKLIFLEKSML